MYRIFLCFILAAGMAHAQDSTQSGVTRVITAHDLYAIALAEQDPLTMIAAAQLAASVALMPVEREAETSGPATADQAEGDAAPDAAAMLAAATGLIGSDESLGILLADAISASRLVPQAGVRSTRHSLSPDRTDSWRLPFDGQIVAELAILGGGNGNLDLRVTDASGATLCTERGPGDRLRCSFMLPESGYVTAAVQNRGPNAATYLLLTN